MKRFLWIFLCSMGLFGSAYGLTFVASEPVAASDDNLLHILPRPDRQEEPGAVLFIKTDILQVSVRGAVLSVPRRVNEGYVVFVAQGATGLILNAPLYATQQISFPALKGGKYYEMTLTSLENNEAAQAAKRRSQELDLDHTQVGLSLELDYMDFPQEIAQESRFNSLVYLDKTLNFSQWQKLLVPHGPYQPYDVSGNPKNPCCILVRDDTPIEEVFRMKQVEMDSYVETLEAGNTYHTTLSLTSNN